MTRLLLLSTLLFPLAACGNSTITNPDGGDGDGDGDTLNPPGGLSYSTNEGRYLLQVPIPDNIPTVEGDVRVWSITPDLP